MCQLGCENTSTRVIHRIDNPNWKQTYIKYEGDDKYTNPIPR